MIIFYHYALKTEELSLGKKTLKPFLYYYQRLKALIKLKLDTLLDE